MARSVWKGPFVDGYLLKKADNSRASGRNEVIKIWARRSTIMPQFVGLTFGPITFMVCVLGGLGNMIGGFIAAFIFAEFIALGGFYAEVEWGYVLAFVFFIVMMFIRPQGILGSRN